MYQIFDQIDNRDYMDLEYVGHRQDMQKLYLSDLQIVQIDLGYPCVYQTNYDDQLSISDNHSRVVQKPIHYIRYLYQTSLYDPFFHPKLNMYSNVIY